MTESPSHLQASPSSNHCDDCNYYKLCMHLNLSVSECDCGEQSTPYIIEEE